MDFGKILGKINDSKKEPNEISKEKEQQPVSDEIVEKILSQNDRLGILMEVMGKLPTELVLWLEGWLKSETSTRSYVEIDISSVVNAPLIYTGDLVIKKHTNPKVGDIGQFNFRVTNSNEYGSSLCKVLSVDFKKSSMSVQDILNPDTSWTAGVHNVLYVLDRVIPYGTDEWEELVQIMKIDYNNSEIKTWITTSLEFVEKAENFYQKEKTIKLLKERLEYLNKNGRYHS